MLAAIAMLASMTPPVPGVPIRLYHPHAAIALDQWEADPTLRAPGGPFAGTELSVLTYDQNSFADAADMAEVCWRARDMGIPCTPAMRVYPFLGTVEENEAQAVTAEWWQGVASVLGAVVELSDPAGVKRWPDTLPGGDGRVCLDVEDYTPTLALDDAALARQGIDRATLQARMAPVLDLLADVDLCAYPLNPSDHAHDLIAKAARSLEIWDEHSFGIVDDRRTSPAAYADEHRSLAAPHAAYRIAYPGALIRYGLQDDYLRAWGETARVDSIELMGGGLPPWVFRYNRADTTSAHIGSWAWVNGTKLDSRNDVQSKYVLGLGSIGPRWVPGSVWCAQTVNSGENAHGSIWGTCVSQGHSAQTGEHGGTIVDDGEYFWPYTNSPHDVLPDDDFTVAAEIVVPSTTTGNAALLGSFSDWGVYAENGMASVRYIDGDGAHTAEFGSIPLDTPTVVLFGVTDGTVRVGIAGSGYEQPTVGRVPTTSKSHIYLGRAYVDGQWAYCEGCELISLTIWPRLLGGPGGDGCAEYEDSAAWPWGRQ